MCWGSSIERRGVTYLREHIAQKNFYMPKSDKAAVVKTKIEGSNLMTHISFFMPKIKSSIVLPHWYYVLIEALEFEIIYGCVQCNTTTPKPTLVLFVAQGPTCHGMMGMK